MIEEVPCPHCGEVLKVNPDALGSTLVCHKCHVILRLAKDDDKPSLFAKVRRLLRRKKVIAGLVCLLVLAAFAVGLNVGSGVSRGGGNNRGIVMTSVGLFFAHNELHVNDNPPPKADDGDAPR
jgi:hypothetical protein